MKNVKPSSVASKAHRFIAMLAAFTLAFSFLGTASLTAAAKAFAAEGTDQGTLASGEWGTCPWDISEDGTLTVHPGEGADTNGTSPWNNYLASIKRVVFAQENGNKVVAPQSLFGLFRNNISRTCAIESVDFSNFDTSNVTDMRDMFCDCPSLTELDFSNFNTSNVTTMGDMFIGCSSLTKLDLSTFDTSNVTDMGGMFWACSSLTKLDLSSFDTSNVTDMFGMFIYCSAFTELDLSNFDTSNVTRLGGMFNSCSSLTKLDLSSFDTSNVTDMGGMFYDCTSLTKLDLSSFDTSNVTDMGVMFGNCSSLTELDLSNFRTSNVTEMEIMFSGCSSLTELDFSNFDTSNVTKMYNMFDGCSALTELDLSNFDTSNVTEMASMFDECDALVKVKVGSAFNFKEYFFDNGDSVLPVFPDGFWKSEKTGCIYTPECIAKGRSGFADTYTKVEATSPSIVSGNGAKWKLDSDEGATFTSDADFIDFVRVEVDGNMVDASNYDVQSGSTIVTLKPDYMKTLSVGEHKLSIVFEIGTATATFTVQSATASDEPADNPSDNPTGNQSSENPGTEPSTEPSEEPAEPSSGIVIVDEDVTGVTVDPESELEVAESDNVKLEVTPVSEESVEHKTITEKISEKSQLAGVYDASLFVNDVKKADNFGSITLVFPVDKKWNSRNVRVWHIHDGGEPEFQYSIVKNGKVTVTTSRLSVFGIEILDPSEVIPSDDLDTPDVPAADTEVKTQVMFRLYNPNSGEHFYTADSHEKNHLVSLGWNDEGTGWVAPTSGDPVYRLYNPNAGEHHFTKDIAEKEFLEKAGWTFERIGWYSGGEVRLYREYNHNAYANNHNYTTDKGEHDWLLSLGWNDEGYAWNAVAAK